MNRNLERVIEKLRILSPPELSTLRLPTEGEIDEAERILNLKFHEDYRYFLLKASHIVHFDLELYVATITEKETYIFNLFYLCETAWGERKIPKNIMPFAALTRFHEDDYLGWEDLSQYYCYNNSGEIVFWSSLGQLEGHWPNLEVWIKTVWNKDIDNQC